MAMNAYRGGFMLRDRIRIADMRGLDSSRNLSLALRTWRQILSN